MQRFVWLLLIWVSFLPKASFSYTWTDKFVGFSADEQAFFHAVTRMVYNKLLQDNDVYRCIKRTAKTESVHIKDLEALYGDHWPKGGLFDSQRGTLRVFVHNDTTVPDIRFIGKRNPEDFAWARGNYKKVWTLCKNETDTHCWRGTFEMEINLAKYDENQNVNSWAGVVAHEMMHNLMHMHPDPKKVGLEEAYRSDYQINAVQNCVSGHGAAARNQRCGGRYDE